MPTPKINPYIKRVEILTEQALEASYRLDSAREEYEAALIALARGVEKMQWVNGQMRRERAIRHIKRRVRMQIYTMRKAG